MVHSLQDSKLVENRQIDKKNLFHQILVCSCLAGGNNLRYVYLSYI